MSSGRLEGQEKWRKKCFHSLTKLLLRTTCRGYTVRSEKRRRKQESSTKNEEIKQYTKRVNDYHVAGFFSNQTVFGDVNVNTVWTDSDYKQSPSSYKCMYIAQQQVKNASFFIIKKRKTFWTVLPLTISHDDFCRLNVCYSGFRFTAL